VILAGMLLAFWYPTPTRDHWLWLLVFIPALLLVRWLVYGHLWTRTPLDVWLIIFLVICLINVLVADSGAPPFRRTSDPAYSFLVLICRPLLGVALIVYFVEYARLHQRLDGLLMATLVMGGIVGVLALGASQWTTKSAQLYALVEMMPNIRDSLAPFDAKGGFNVNEIAGALAWLCPVAAGLTVYQWRRWTRPLRWVSAVVFGGLLMALMLGQSRFALAGVLVGLMLLAGLLLPKRERRIAWGLLLALGIIEFLIVLNVFSARAVLLERDQSSFTTRLYLWRSVGYILSDHPLTGVGLNMFRDGRVRNLYPVPEYRQPVLPHAHQEWLQIGADAGLPGLVVFLALQGAVAVMLYRSYRRGDASARAVAVGVGTGLLAHAVFGLGDAITLWDRFAFLGWWLIALSAAQYHLVQNAGVTKANSEAVAVS
jgi:putative inorganic carbon (HCO3(-)) transporter